MERSLRWDALAAGLAASLLPALWLTLAFAPTESALPNFFNILREIVVGPLTYLAFGQPDGCFPHPMHGASCWAYLACSLPILALLIKPRPATALAALAGFLVWYGWAFLTLAAYEF